MQKNTLLVTGACGLIGSAMVKSLHKQFDLVIGVDNNQRSKFFGSHGDTTEIQKYLIENIDNYRHRDLDIRNRDGVVRLIKETKPTAIIHCAAQPSHDLAASIPFEDFEINALATLNLLEASRQNNPDVNFIFLSTNKVYGDHPNLLPLKELKTRFEYALDIHESGIDETMSIDQCTHSLFGVSKVAADLLVQEYGRNFGMSTVCLRGGCLTGPAHRGAQLHGFLSYLGRCVAKDMNYTIFGYKGKQVRDNIHCDDVASLVRLILEKPVIGEVFNLGGGAQNSCSMLEAIQAFEAISGRKLRYEYNDKHRTGDHICYYSNLSKIKSEYPGWKIEKNLEKIYEEIYQSWMN